MTFAVARFADGRTARTREVTLTVEDRMLVIGADGVVLDRWPVTAVRGLPDSARGELVLRPVDGDARLLLSRADAVDWAKTHLPRLGDRVHDPVGWRRIALWATGAVGAVALMVLVLIPALADVLATRIPPAREAAFGEALRDQLAEALARDDAATPYCQDPAGTQALERLTERLLTRAELPVPVEIRVVDSRLINALALPGGQILLFDGLLAEAEGPDEIAGVLAHELGHVAARDPTRLALRAAGSAGLLGLLVGDVFGGAAMVAAANALLDASFTREAERAADRYALARLQAAEIAPTGFATFFARLAEEHGAGPAALAWFRSHPPLADRGARAAAVEPGATRPALEQADWRALQAICAPPAGPR